MQVGETPLATALLFPQDGAQLSLDAPLVAEAGYTGEADVVMEVLLGESIVGVLPLAPILRDQSVGSVQRVSVLAVGSDASSDGDGTPPEAALASISFTRAGGPPPPGPLTLLNGQIAPTTARLALDAKKAGLGDAADEYVGQFRNGLPHGIGKCHYASGAVYDGQWMDGLKHGQGEYRDEYGSVYRGGFAKGTYSGLGAWHYADGATYRGPMVGGKRHGHGLYRAADGASYDGQWEAGERCGHGVDVSADGLTTYDGGWLRDVRHGHGKLVVSERSLGHGTPPPC